jgi:hypothetical protein
MTLDFTETASDFYQYLINHGGINSHSRTNYMSPKIKLNLMFPNFYRKKFQTKNKFSSYFFNTSNGISIKG